MKILPVNYINYQSKTNNCGPVRKCGYQQNPMFTEPRSVNFKKGGGAIAAGVFGAILGGAALVFAAPIAVVAGAAALGAAGGAALAEDDEPYNDVENYKYTHEY